MSIDLIIKICSFAITLAGFVWSMAIAFARIKQNTKEIEDLKNKTDLTTNLLNEISKSIAEINVKLSFLMKDRDGEK